VRFQVLAATSMKMAVVWDVTSCTLVDNDRRFRGSYCLHHQGLEAINKTTQRHSPEDRRMKSDRRTDTTSDLCHDFKQFLQSKRNKPKVHTAFVTYCSENNRLCWQTSSVARLTDTHR
jgi:hypothetical protein